MLRRQQQVRTQFLRLLDAGLFALSFWLAHFFRANAKELGEGPVRALARIGSEAEILPFETYLPLFFMVIPLSFLFLESHGYYRRPLLTNRWRNFWQLVQVCFMVTIGLVFVMFVLKTPSARGVLLLFSVLSLVVMTIRDEVFRAWLGARRSSGAFKRRLLLIGSPVDTARLRRELEARAAHDAHVIAEVDLNEASNGRLLDILHHQAPNGVVLAADHANFAHIEKIIQSCELEGVEVWLLADFFKTTISRTSVDDLYGRPLLVFHSGPETSWRSVAKRSLDMTLSALLMLLLSPFLLLIAALIKLASRGPVLYSDVRSGLNGKPFTMFKFRSMVVNANELKPQLAHRNEMTGPVFKVTGDPRVTRLGAFLRKYSLDELPQLWNVLRGEMSLVGPRPLVVEEIHRFDDFAHRRRLSVRPGLTCLWQVNGRSNVREFTDWMQMDLNYIDDWSLWLDFKILLRTIPTVLSGNGAK